MGITSAHGPEEDAWEVESNRGLPRAEQLNQARPLPAAAHPQHQHPAPRDAGVLQGGPAASLSSDPDVAAGRGEDSCDDPLRLLRVCLHAARPAEQRSYVPARHGPDLPPDQLCLRVPGRRSNLLT